MKILELFSGYGTASFALKRLGIPYECVGYSDIDKYANQCFRQNHYNTKGNYIVSPMELGDATKINPSDLPDFDLLTGGFPCQAFSVAGKGLGELDTRGTLFNEIIRIAEVKKPRYMLLENVKGLTNKNHVGTFRKILSELNRVGYKVSWKILNTKDYGIPQNRERVWFACFREEGDYYNFKFPDKEELKIFLKDILEEEVDNKYYLKESQVKSLMSGIQKSKINPEIANALQHPGHSGGNYRGMNMVKETPGCIQIGSIPREILNDNERQRRVYIPEGCSPSILNRSDSQKIIQKIGDRDKNNYSIKTDYSNCIPANPMSDRGQLLVEPKIYDNYNKRFKEGGITGTIGRGNGSSTSAGSFSIITSVSMANDGFRIRKLTPKECFRLQGFLNDEVNLDGLSNTQKYKLAGNGQSLNVVEKIFRRMFAITAI